MWKYLVLFGGLWLFGCSVAPCQGYTTRCVRSLPLPLYHFIPVRLYTPQTLLEGLNHGELQRERRQQQIVQEVILENNFGGGFGGPSFGPPPFGRPPFGGGGFGPGRFGPGRGFGGGFGGSFGGGFGGSFARSYNQEEEKLPVPQYSAPATPSAPAYSAPAPCAPPAAPSAPAPPAPSGIPSPECPKNYVFSCEAVFKPVPCAASSSCGY
ncbi:uncharacterized protein Vm26Ac [Drosophila pseudoobscura]|uniref:Uncharacterized protein Vm26Ac n=1 Tax=Drosophila pseudoobscura pseudoobscura TaxID=46245 RepID=A0A6I8UWU6_DROPS|nr:uncharacterized protein LOC6903338 [Drosophila pseudoobscura]